MSQKLPSQFITFHQFATALLAFQAALGGVGAPGEQGIQGIPGEQGIQGIPGEQGIQGIQGEQGGQGIQGEQGGQGIQGEQGAPGEVTNSALATALENHVQRSDEMDLEGLPAMGGGGVGMTLEEAGTAIWALVQWANKVITAFHRLP